MHTSIATCRHPTPPGTPYTGCPSAAALYGQNSSLPASTCGQAGLLPPQHWVSHLPLATWTHPQLLTQHHTAPLLGAETGNSCWRRLTADAAGVIETTVAKGEPRSHKVTLHGPPVGQPWVFSTRLGVLASELHVCKFKTA